MVSDHNVCSVCGGDGKYTNAFGSHSSCPGCRGTGRAHTQIGLGTGTDIINTKKRSAKPVVIKPPRATKAWSIKGMELEKQILSETRLSSDSKKKLIEEIISFEETKGSLTETFRKKLWKKLPK
jgi:hypothetical protein